MQASLGKKCVSSCVYKTLHVGEETTLCQRGEGCLPIHAWFREGPKRQNLGGDRQVAALLHSWAPPPPPPALPGAERGCHPPLLATPLRFSFHLRWASVVGCSPCWSRLSLIEQGNLSTAQPGCHDPPAMAAAAGGPEGQPGRLACV